MTTTEISNIIVDRSLPHFVRENYPLFESFITAYYQWLELSKQPNDITQNLTNYRGIDSTLDEFVDYFRTEYLINIPTEVLADKRLLAKQIKNFYKNKGNEDSYRFLFRILYNEDIEFYYPKVDILKASDGKWVQTISIKIAKGALLDNDLAFLYNGTLQGQTSNAIANVSAITEYTARGIQVLELELINIKGTFLSGEQLIVTPDDSNHPTIHILEIYYKINLTNGGTHYRVGDKINLLDNMSVKIGEATVKQIGRGKISSISPSAAGVGYRGEERNVTVFAYLPIDYTWTSIYLPDSPIQGGAYDFADSQIGFTISNVTVVDTGDIINIIDSPDPIGSGASGVVTLVSQTGGILAVSLTDKGKDYNVPFATIQSVDGTGGAVSVFGGGGAIQSTQITTFPITLPATDITSVDFSPGSGIDAAGTLVNSDGISGMSIYPGFYINTDGQLSSNKKLQDNYYYQDFSYVILSALTYNKWKDIVGKILHPAGLKSFGKLQFATKYTLDTTNAIDASILLGINIIAPQGHLLLSDGSNLLLSDGNSQLLLEE